jgi:hypothetical protein
MVNIYDVMKGYKIVIVDSGLTKKQRCTLVSLRFKSSNSLPTTWTYKAMDTPDLIDVIEDLLKIKSVKSWKWIITES